MDSKTLTENGWKAITYKYKVKDNGLQKGLAAYEKLEDCKFNERMLALGHVSLSAGTLSKTKEVASIPAVGKYLSDIMDAVTSTLKDVKGDAKNAEQDAKIAVNEYERRIDKALGVMKEGVRDFCDRYRDGLRMFEGAMGEGKDSKVEDTEGLKGVLESAFEILVEVVIVSKFEKAADLAKALLGGTVKLVGKAAIQQAGKGFSEGGANGATYHDFVVGWTKDIPALQNAMSKPVNDITTAIQTALKKAATGCGTDVRGTGEAFTTSVEAFAEAYKAKLAETKAQHFLRKFSKYFIDSRKGNTDSAAEVLGVKLTIPGRKSGVLNFGLYVMPKGDGRFVKLKASPKWKLVFKGTPEEARGFAQGLTDDGFDPKTTELEKRIHLYLKAGPMALADGVLHFAPKAGDKWSSIDGDRAKVEEAWADKDVKRWAMEITEVEGDNK